MSLLSKLFGGKSNPGAAPIDHNGYLVFVAPQKEPGGFRVAARIEKETEAETLVCHMIRADVCSSLEDAEETTKRKAISYIDQLGDAIFDA